MTELVTPECMGFPGLPERIERPVLSRSLGQMIRLVENEGSPLVGVAARFWPALRGEAAEAVLVLRSACQPAPFGIIEAWMSWVAMGCARTPDAVSKTVRTAMVADLCGDLPAFVWTRATRRSFAVRGPEGRFWPSDNEVAMFLKPLAFPVQQQLAALEAMFAAERRAAVKARDAEGEGAMPASLAPPSAALALADHVAASLRMPPLYGERQPVQPSPERARPKPAYATGEQLAQMRARAGIKPLPRRDQGGRGE